jgi:hypothetical protein
MRGASKALNDNSGVPAFPRIIIITVVGTSRLVL